MYGNCVDDELDDYLANIEDVANGLIVDMEHMELMEPLTDAVSELEDELEKFYETRTRNAIINKMTVDDLNRLIDSIKYLTQTIKEYASRA